MTLTRVELAVLNNVHWYEAMFAAHQLNCETDARVWLCRETPPPFHSNLVVLSPRTTQVELTAYIADLATRPLPSDWCLKDSYARFDLAAFGFSMRFQAEWIWRDPLPATAAACAGSLTWTRVSTPTSLMAWERAWSGESARTAVAPETRQFPDSLLSSPDHAFFAGLLEGTIVAGGIANRSPGVVGLSNVFSPPERLQETWAALTMSLGAQFPGTPIVGFERGSDLRAAMDVGFVPVGDLRLWCRSS